MVYVAFVATPFSAHCIALVLPDPPTPEAMSRFLERVPVSVRCYTHTKLLAATQSPPRWRGAFIFHRVDSDHHR